MTIEVGIPSTADLASINQISCQQESYLGPLVDMGNDGKQTQLYFDTDTNSPTVSAVIAPKKTPVPAGSTIVAMGIILVSGVLTPSQATRG